MYGWRWTVKSEVYVAYGISCEIKANTYLLHLVFGQKTTKKREKNVSHMIYDSDGKEIVFSLPSYNDISLETHYMWIVEDSTE